MKSHISGCSEFDKSDNEIDRLQFPETLAWHWTPHVYGIKVDDS